MIYKIQFTVPEKKQEKKEKKKKKLKNAIDKSSDVYMKIEICVYFPLIIIGYSYYYHSMNRTEG